MWPGGFVAGCRARWAVPASSSFENIFLYDFILIYLNSREIHAYQCTNPVDLPWRTGDGPASVRCYKHRSDSGPVVVCWDTYIYRSKWWNIVNCTGYMVFLASLHVVGGVCASGKLALADISTRSTGPSSAGWAVSPPPLPRDFVGSRGIFSNRPEIGQASRQPLCRVACQILGRHVQHSCLILRLWGPPGFSGRVSCPATDRDPK